MTTLKLKTNLKCGNCVAKVTPHLNNLPGVASWAVDTADPDKVLTVTGDGLTAGTIGDAVAKAGFQVLGPTESAKPKAATYFPLVLIVLYLVGTVGLIQWASGRFDWHSAMAQFMAGFFLVFSFFKLLDLRAFASAYSSYDVVAAAVPAYGYAYPFLELALGAAYLSGFNPPLTNAATLVLMLVGLAGVVRTLLAKRQVRCACLGAVFELPMSYVTLAEDGLMAAMAIIMLFTS